MPCLVRHEDFLHIFFKDFIHFRINVYFLIRFTYEVVFHSESRDFFDLLSVVDGAE